jgi:Fe-Mn family superoxide dismutase
MRWPGGVPILALDMYEHAYHLDFGAAAGAYVDAFMANIDWAQVYERYQGAVHGASELFGADQDELADAEVLDVRRVGMFEKAEALIPGASWRDPASVDAWAGDVPGTSKSWSIASTATRSDAPPRFACEPEASRPAS